MLYLLLKHHTRTSQNVCNSLHCWSLDKEKKVCSKELVSLPHFKTKPPKSPTPQSQDHTIEWVLLAEVVSWQATCSLLVLRPVAQKCLGAASDGAPPPFTCRPACCSGRWRRWRCWWPGTSPRTGSGPPGEAVDSRKPEGNTEWAGRGTPPSSCRHERPCCSNWMLTKWRSDDRLMEFNKGSYIHFIEFLKWANTQSSRKAKHLNLNPQVQLLHFTPLRWLTNNKIAQLTCFCWSSSRSPHLYFSVPATSPRCSPPPVSSPGGLCFASVPPGSCFTRNQCYAKMW